MTDDPLGVQHPAARVGVRFRGVIRASEMPSKIISRWVSTPAGWTTDPTCVVTYLYEKWNDTTGECGTYGVKRCIYLYLDCFIDGLAQELAGVLALDAHRADIDLEFRGELTAALRMLDDDDEYDQICKDHTLKDNFYSMHRQDVRIR